MESLFIKPLQKLINYELLLKTMISKMKFQCDPIYKKINIIYNNFKDINNKCNEQIIQI